MKILFQGKSYARVQVSLDEVRAFKSRWPCNNLPDSEIWFEFRREFGIYALVDIGMGKYDHRNHDGSALLALSQDAELFAKRNYKHGEV